MPVKKVYFFGVLVAIFGYLISLSLLHNYTEGDQVQYRIFYDKIVGLSFFDAGLVAEIEISSKEPLTLLILWLGANLGVSKDIWISLLNVVLIMGLYTLLSKHKAPWFVILLFFSNFYFLVLITSAERLKISYIFIIYAFLFSSYKRGLLLLLAPLAHLQSFVFLFGLIASVSHKELLNIVFKLRINKRAPIRVVILTVTAFMLIYLLMEGFVLKIDAYMHSAELFSFVNIVLLMIIVVAATKNKSRMILALIPMFIAVGVVGGDRVNMIAVTLALGLLIFEQRLKHPLVLMLLLYYAIKSIPYIISVYEYGDGFYGSLNG